MSAIFLKLSLFILLIFFALSFLSFFEDGPPPCSPSKVRWLKAYNKVRVQLLEVEDSLLLHTPTSLFVCFSFLHSHTHRHVHISLSAQGNQIRKIPYLHIQIQIYRHMNIAVSLSLSSLSCNASISTSFPLWVG